MSTRELSFPARASARAFIFVANLEAPLLSTRDPSSQLPTGLSLPGASQTSAELQDYFKNSIGLSQDQIADIRGGKAVGKVMKSRTPDEIFVFGAVYIKAPLKVTFSLQLISTVLGNFRNFWPSENSAIHPSPPILRASSSIAMT